MTSSVNLPGEGRQLQQPPASQNGSSARALQLKIIEQIEGWGVHLAAALDRTAPLRITDTQQPVRRAGGGQDEVGSSLNSPKTKDGSYVARRRGRVW